MAFIHWVSVAFSPRSRLTTGSATFAIVASMMTRATPRAMPTSPIHRVRSRTAVDPGVCIALLTG